MKSNIIEAELHQKKALQQISENSFNKMKAMYDDNKKTKSTLTQLRGLQHNLIYEKDANEEDLLKLRKIPMKQAEI